MIVVDTSALICIYAEEEGFERCVQCLLEADVAHLPVSVYVEFSLISKLGEARHEWIERLVESGVVSLTELSPEQGFLAAGAARRYGKGSRHPARLNFGDCLVYAVAKYRNLPLLFVGGDFAQTDLASALS